MRSIRWILATAAGGQASVLRQRGPWRSPVTLSLLMLLVGLPACASLLGPSKSQKSAEATIACRDDAAGCLKKCNGGDSLSCAALDRYYAMGASAFVEVLRNEPRWASGDEVLARLKKHCDDGDRSACDTGFDVLRCAKPEIRAKDEDCQRYLLPGVVGQHASAEKTSTSSDQQAGAAAPSSTSAKSGAKTSGPTAGDVLRQADAAKQKADKAVRLVKNTDTTRAANEIGYCRASKQECLRRGEEAADRVAGLAGSAMCLARQVQPNMDKDWILTFKADIARAEDLAEEALAEAQRTVGAHERMEAEARNEQDAANAARTTCDSNPGACRKQCEKDELMMCIAWGSRLAREKKYAEARPFFQKACDRKSALGCLLVAESGKMEKEAKQRADDLWAPVVSVGDDIAQRQHMAAFARQYAPTAQNLAAAQRVDAHVAMLIKDSYCPAAVAFLRVSTRADFQARAKEHCDQNPPTGSGLGGEEVVLTAGCRQVFATACPGSP